MDRHSFNPFSAILGVLAIAAGLLVAAGDVDLDADLTWWAAGAAILVGVAIIPWRRSPSDPEPG